MYGEDKPYSKMDEHEKKYQCEDDMRALTRVAAIKKDKVRHRRAMDYAKMQIKELNAVAGKG